MELSIKHLKDLAQRVDSFTQFTSCIFKFPHWYLTGLQSWTKRDLWSFYGQNGGK